MIPLWWRWRRALGRLLGYERELSAMRQRVLELSWDDAFGMWTRRAFLQFCRLMPRGRRAVVFLDLDRMHELNGRLGFAEVDRRVRAMFAIPFRRSDLVARWYSGDEIAILLDGDPAAAAVKIVQLQRAAAAQGLSFLHAVGEWDVGRQSIEEVVDEPAAEVMGAKKTAESPGAAPPAAEE